MAPSYPSSQLFQRKCSLLLENTIPSRGDPPPSRLGGVLTPYHSQDIRKPWGQGITNESVCSCKQPVFLPAFNHTWILLARHQSTPKTEIHFYVNPFSGSRVSPCRKTKKTAAFPMRTRLKIGSWNALMHLKLFRNVRHIQHTLRNTKKRSGR